MTLNDLSLVLPTSLTILAVTSLWALANTRKIKTLILVVPLVIVCALGSYVSIMTLYGYPTEQVMEEDNIYVKHLVDKKADRIYVWAITKDNLPRAYSIPYTKEDEEKLNKAAERQEEGIPQMVSGTDPGDEHGSERNDGIRIWDFDMRTQNPK